MELKYRTGLRRIGAAIVDNIVMWPFSLFITMLSVSMDDEVIRTYSYFIAALPVTYSIIGHYKYGMTIGKWVARIKVIDVSESKNITLRQAFLRDIAFVILTIVDITVDILVRRSWEIGDIPGYIYWVSTVAGSAALLWTLLEIISMLTNSKRRAIHDFIAGTVVVRTDEFERTKLINESFNNAGDQ